MQNNSSKKTIIIIIIVIVIAGFAYFYYKGAPEDTSSSLTMEGGSIETSANNVGLNVLALLNQINSIKIDTKLFQSNTYKSLVDHTVIVREQNVGKANPFVGTFGLPTPKK